MSTIVGESHAGVEKKSYEVVFADGRVFSAEERAKKVISYLTALSEHHGRTWGAGAPLYCRCVEPPAGERHPLTRLYVAKRDKGSGEYYIARYPDSGPLHSPDCEWWELPRESSGLDGYESSVVKELEDGTAKVKLRRSLRENLVERTGEATPPEKGPPPVGRKSQTAMTLRGLLDFLWERAEINTWHPGMAGKRTPGVVHRRLVEASRTVKAGYDCLDDCSLFFFQGLHGGEWGSLIRRNLTVLERRWENSNNRTRQKVLAVGVANGLKIVLEGHRFELDGAPHQHINVMVSKQMVERMAKSFSCIQRLKEGSLKAGERVLVLLLCEIRELGNALAEKQRWTRLEVQAGAATIITDQWIPVESGYERLIVNRLVECERSFIKPLRYDATRDVMFPDVILTDGDPPLIPMEIYGRNDPAYKARQAEKEELYERLFPGGGHWSWDVTEEGTAPPEFPPKKPWQRRAKEKTGT
ncbi:DUF1173 family protein [Nitrospirillum amazonense]|uniref:DUF1173 family protein n=1 Tax=Nitrospirillum amazonense TaxID=28077 RepID=UPI0024128965|nr:DUF1173 family protein [Nitrospirillum amazonense]MDG3444645.1 DUF1173 family protein [Nitrospirillum amazonense]